MKSLSRALEILRSVSDRASPLTVEEIAAATQMPASSVYRFLRALRGHGLITLDPDTRKYRLGPTLHHLGTRATSPLELRPIARPVMERLAAKSGESSFLSVLSGEESVYVETVESRELVRFTESIGRRVPLHAGAASKVLLAHLPEEKREVLIRRMTLPRLARNTITSKATLRARLTLIRARGYDVSNEEVTRGAWGLAAPIFDAEGRIIASLAILGLRFRLDPKKLPRLAHLVTHSAEEISHHLLPAGQGRAVPQQGHTRQAGNRRTS